MLGIDLSALSGPELRQLLKTAHARGQGPLADQIQWELAARAAGGRSVAAAADLPLPEPAPALGQVTPVDQGRPPSSRRSGVLGGVTLMAVGAIAGCLGAVAALEGREFLGRRPSPPPVAEEAPRLMAARAETVPSLQEAVPALELPPAPEAVAAPARASAAPGPARTRSTADRPLARRSGANGDRCAAGNLAADRLVCRDAALGELHQQLVLAYAAAVEANADTYVTQEQEAAWRQARDSATDRQRLRELYDERIRELNMAAAAGREREEPPY